MTYRVFVTGSGIAKPAQEFLENEGCILIQGDPADSSGDIARKVRSFGADALIVRQGRIDEDVITASANLKAICKHGIGTDNIDIRAASRHNIPVMYTPDATSGAAAEHTLGLILALTRRIPDQDAKIRRGIFDKTGFSGQELTGKTLGLIGFGRIARRLSELVAPFNLKVIAHHTSSSNEPLPPYISKERLLNEVLSKSDIVSLHVPLTEDTEGMIDTGAFEIMKSTAFLINTARGRLVNEGHLIKALQEGLIGGAALDTFDEEPPPPGSPLYALENTVLTMHTAGNSDLSLMNMAFGAAQNILTALRKEPLDTRLVINAKQITLETCE
jgi:D-3-phosphoglycerate dehydrogenase